jgi:sugar phosphate isomerase/epimerase
MHNWMRSEPLEVTLARLARCGYGSIEIKGEPDQYDTKDVRKLLDDYKLSCWGAVTLTLGDRNLCAKDEQQRAATVQYMKDVVTMVKELDGQEITIVPATVGKVVPDGTPDDEWGWCVDGLKEVHELASASGVRIAIEGLNRFETYFINRGDQALALANAVAPDVGVCLDAFHMNIEEIDFFQAIRDVGDRLVDFHVADNNRMPPGQGAIDWEALVGELAGIGYDDYLTVEFVATVDRSPLSQRTEIADASEAGASQGMEQFLRDHGTGALPEHYYDQYVQESIDRLRKALDSVGAAA